MHFSKVSEQRFERDIREIMETAQETTKRTDNKAQIASSVLEEEISFTEFRDELGKMRDGAPGNDGVSVRAIRSLSTKVQKYLFQSTIDHLTVPFDQWPEEMKEGWVIPLHKKGPRNDANNYRGVCLLPLISRIIARVYASRIRIWAEDLDILGENQCGFRENRSTADATQIILRIDEEVKRVYGKCDERQTKRPGAILLDITKAYPRVNRPLLWKILENLGMGNRTLSILKGLHENTEYRVKGRQGLSEKWQPLRGLREGCATSPILFNVYHAEAMKLASEARKDNADQRGQECGLTWSWVPGNDLPALEPKRTVSSSMREEFRITESLFADDSTLIGWLEELMEGKEVVKRNMLNFEEKCHDGKEEVLPFATSEANPIKMLGTKVGKKDDVALRIKRGNCAWARVRRWLWRSNLKKRTKAIIVQAVVESSMLFDCNVRGWSTTDTKRLQSVADKAYRFVWNSGRGLTLIRMQEEQVNMYEIRHQLGIDSIRQKVEIRSLQRIGHLLRMPNSRLTKKVVLGRWTEEKEQSGLLRSSMISYWRRLIKEAGEDWTNAGNMASNRKVWRKFVNRRKGEIREWEDEMRSVRSNETKPRRSRTKEPDDFTCRIAGCGKKCKNKSGLVQHERKAHKLGGSAFKCPNCEREFKEKSNLTNHYKACTGNPRRLGLKSITQEERVPCQRCGARITKSNMARHERLHEL